MGAKEKTSKEWKWQRCIVTHPLSESQWNRVHFSIIKMESEKHKCWCMPADGPCSHRWLSTGHGRNVESMSVGQWCNWIMMKNWDPCTVWMALWRLHLRSSVPQDGGAGGILLLCQESDWAHQVACRQQIKCRSVVERRNNALIRQLAMPTCGSKIWESCTCFLSKEILVEVVHVKAHTKRKDKKEMSHFENVCHRWR